MQKDKVRIYVLARELNMESKDLVDLCREHGIDVKNQLSSLDPDQRDAIELLVKRGKGASTPPPVAKAVAPVIPVVPSPVPVLKNRRAAGTPATPVAPETPATVQAPPPSAPAVPTVEVEVEPEREPEPLPEPEPPVIVVTPPVEEPEPPAVPEVPAPPAAVAPLPPPAVTKPTMPTPPTPPAPTPPRPPEATPPTTPTPSVGRTPTLPSRIPPRVPGRVPDLNQPRPDSGQRKRREIPRPGSAPAPLPKPPPPLKTLAPKKDDKKPGDKPGILQPIMRLPTEEMRGKANIQDIINRAATGETLVPPPEIDEEDDAGKGKGGARPGQVGDRAKRHQQRNERAKLRKDRVETEVVGGKLVVNIAEDMRHHKLRRGHKQSKKQLATMPRAGKVPLTMPITVRSLCEAVGQTFGKVYFQLQSHGAPPTVNINSTLSPDLAELVAIDFGVELDIKRPASVEEEILARFQKPDSPEDVVPRAPVVTVMGHVDHGKTSLLDRIRKSNVVATEAGGITQVIRAWRVEHGGHPITFLDTPGHEAFTKMRARGAQVTDIAVIVVAADDGVMPTTEEAINHAKAAGVSLVVAINKVDLPQANLNKTRQQLYSMNVLPDNMGGDTPFVETSAASGKGIDELLDQISLVAELKELKANPNKPAKGTCLETNLSEGQGVLATLLVQEGTLRQGDVILCGASYGRVRAMYNDHGQPIDEAGPSVPVRITGLDEVPNADDPFVAVPDLAQAREVAQIRKDRLQQSTAIRREPAKLETLSAAKVSELKIILKADFRGSVEAIRKELEKLQHEEVRTRVLHAAIGGITESDVQLALTSPEDTIIVGFNVVPDDRALILGQERGVQIREYDIIYNLTNDIRAALEGKLKPREEVIHLGRAVIRDTFKISRVGTIAGCYVTQGTIERSAKVRVIREGVVIYPPPDRTASLESLKRFKDDAREVREGFECGMKVAGYDDIKVGDVIEAYRVEQVQRTL